MASNNEINKGTVRIPDSELGSKPHVRRTDQKYDYDYFSGAITNLYIGDILVDEVTSLKYNLEQQKRPVYGYASSNWNFMARGTTIVTGYFTINFKEAGYLYYVLEYFNNLNVGVDRATAPILEPVTQKNKGQVTISKENIERLINGNIDYDRNEFYTSLASLEDEEFEDLAEKFEDKIWNQSARKLEETRTRPDEFSEFDIFITYGNVDSPSVNHTGRRITGVELTGQSQIIEISGEPLQEAYTFIARDVA